MRKEHVHYVLRRFLRSRLCSPTFETITLNENLYALFVLKVGLNVKFMIFVLLTLRQLGFTQAANLRNHERIHTNDRPYVCGDCGKTFTQVNIIFQQLQT